MKNFFFTLILLVCAGMGCFISAQDTFYVKKNARHEVVQHRTAWDSTNVDSIISYTVEYHKPNSTISMRLHQQGPTLQLPSEVYGSGRRVLFTDIIVVDDQGRRYRQPDRYWQNGITVPVNTPAKK